MDMKMVEDAGFWSIFFTEKHAVLTYSFHKKIEKILYFKS